MLGLLLQSRYVELWISHKNGHNGMKWGAEGNRKRSGPPNCSFCATTWRSLLSTAIYTFLSKVVGAKLYF